MRHLKTCAVLLAALLTLATLTGCFAGAGKNSAPGGEIDGAFYQYVPSRALLIVRSEGELSRGSRLFSLSFAGEVRTLYLCGSAASLPAGALEKFTALETVCFGADADNVDLPEGALPARDGAAVAVRFGEKDPENGTDENGVQLGHCPNAAFGGCILCGAHYVYDYKNLYVYIRLDGETKVGFSDDFEGEKRTFDEEGKLRCEGFTTVGGHTRYFKENRMITGASDIDGFRCVFNTNGEMTSKRELDKRLPFTLLLPAILALPAAALAAFGVYALYKKRSAKEGSAPEKTDL